MRRSPLLRRLADAWRLARLANHSPEPVDALVERWVEHRRVTRRAAVQTGLAAAASLAAGCGPRRPPATDGRAGAVGDDQLPVAIVGAGIAGLTAAYRLTQAGVPVRVFEAQNRVGGRMLSLRDRFPDGQVVELGGELIDSNHEHIRALAAEFDIPLDDLAESPDAIDLEVDFFGGVRRSLTEVVEAYRPVAARVERDLATIGGDHDVTFRTPLGAAALDRTSLADWLRSVETEAWFRTLLDVAYTTEYGLETDEQSVLNLLLWIDPAPDPFRVFGDSDERWHTRGGNDRITQALAAGVGSRIETGMRLEALRLRPDGLVALTMTRGGTPIDIAASHVILALPFTMLREVRLEADLTPAKRAAIAELGYGTNAKLMMAFRERLWRTSYRSNGSVLTDLPFQVTWETSRGQRGAAGVLTNFTGGRQGLRIGEDDAAGQAARVVADLARIFPGIDVLRDGMPEARFHWPTHPYVRGSYAAFRPGQWTAFNGACAEPEGRVHFAGEHCSVVAQGFMEGGCETGERAARDVIAALGAGRRSAVAAAIAARVRRASRGRDARRRGTPAAAA